MNPDGIMAGDYLVLRVGKYTGGALVDNSWIGSLARVEANCGGMLLLRVYTLQSRTPFLLSEPWNVRTWQRVSEEFVRTYLALWTESNKMPPLLAADSTSMYGTNWEADQKWSAFLTKLRQAPSADDGEGNEDAE